MATHHHQIARPTVQTVATTGIQQDQTVAFRQDEYAMGLASFLSFIIPLQMVLLFIFRNRMRASSSILAKIGLAIFWIQKIALAIAFWPITLIYLNGRCWNCKKWGHHARHCPDNF